MITNYYLPLLTLPLESWLLNVNVTVTVRKGAVSVDHLGTGSRPHMMTHMSSRPQAASLVTLVNPELVSQTSNLSNQTESGKTKSKSK